MRRCSARSSDLFPSANRDWKATGEQAKEQGSHLRSLTTIFQITLIVPITSPFLLSHSLNLLVLNLLIIIDEFGETSVTDRLVPLPHSLSRLMHRRTRGGSATYFKPGTSPTDYIRPHVALESSELFSACSASEIFYFLLRRPVSFSVYFILPLLRLSWAYRPGVLTIWSFWVRYPSLAFPHLPAQSAEAELTEVTKDSLFPCILLPI